MYIEINDNTVIRDIQQKIADYYPYLQVKFYSKPHKKYEASDPGDQVSPAKKISEVRQTHVSALLEITPVSRIRDIESEFQQRFGLSVQILRKEKGIWVQTTGMDDFTLKELNVLSRNSSDEYILSEPDSEYPEQ
ncbi:MAG: hypothetical protein KTQ13_01655 [Ferruginibacter sp.]|nr:hypothetical protein [Chitinophagaceae bacterium]MBP6285631.1 hypothetical protein [Ferruginibacter sp.]MBU9935328.1 hypothetical protein [Ferruginibacter sp.]